MERPNKNNQKQHEQKITDFESFSKHAGKL